MGIWPQRLASGAAGALFGVLATLWVVHLRGTADRPGQEFAAGKTLDSRVKGPSREDRLKSLRVPQEGIGLLKAQINDLVGSVSSVQEAKDLLASAEDLVADQEARMALGMLIIERAAAIGPPEAVWEMIHASPGQQRNMQIQAFFSATDLTAEQVAALTKDMHSDERNAAMAGHISSIDKLGHLRDFNIEGFQPLDERQRRYLLLKLQMIGDGNVGGQIATSRGETPKRAVEALEAAKDFFDRKIFEWDELCDYISKSRDGSNVDDKWRLLKELSEKHEVAISGAAKRQIVSEMVRASPYQALGKLISDPSAPALDSVGTAASAWLEIDAQKPGEYYRSNNKTWNPEQRTKFATALVEYCLKWQDREAASEWLNQIDDEKMREELSARINGEDKP